jgi:N-acetyl-anhydromuramyl-L-alanine amidase AmpD
MKNWYILVFLFFSYTDVNSQIIFPDNFKIVQKPIVFNDARKNLSIAYLSDHHGIKQTSPTIEPVMIVLHYTAGGTLSSNYNYFNRVEIEKGRALNHKASKLNVSAHFLVDRDGVIYQLLPETTFARHTIGLNYCAIGVENVGGPDSPLTEKQMLANVALVKYLCGKFKIEYLIGHSEYLRFKSSQIWKELDKSYITHKGDPGDVFMKKVRERVAELHLKDAPIATK